MGAVWFAIGIAIGACGIGLLFLQMLRTQMLEAHRSGLSFEQTCAALEAAVNPETGWGMPAPPLDMMATLIKKGHPPANLRQARVYFLCKAQYGKSVLESSPRNAGLLPCSWAVYETTGGGVYVSKLNLGLLGPLMGGKLGATMRQVAQEETGILSTFTAAK